MFKSKRGKDEDKKRPVNKKGKGRPVSKKGRKQAPEQRGVSLTEASQSYREREYKGQSALGGAINVAVAVAVLMVVLGGIWYFFGDNIQRMVGINTEIMVDTAQREREDIEREIEMLRNPQDFESEEAVDPMIQNIDYDALPDEIGVGIHLVGLDIRPGTYLLTKGTAFQYYASELDLAQGRPSGGTLNEDWVEGDPEESRYSAILGNQLMTLTEGQYIEIIDGGMVWNALRPQQEVKINESVILLASNDYVVGQDLPAGYYRLLSTELQSGVGLEISNTITEQDNMTYSAERQTYVILLEGNVIRPDGDAILTRVDKQFTY